MSEKVFDEKLLADALGDRAENVADKELMTEIGSIVLLSIEDNVREGGRYSPGDGDPGTPGAWQGGSQKFVPLAESTKKAYKKKGYDTEKFLDRTAGGMMAAFEIDATDNSVQITNAKEYFPHVTLGTKPGTTPVIPARPILVIQDEDYTEIEEAIVDHIIKKNK